MNGYEIKAAAIGGLKAPRYLGYAVRKNGLHWEFGPTRQAMTPEAVKVAVRDALAVQILIEAPTRSNDL